MIRGDFLFEFIKTFILILLILGVTAIIMFVKSLKNLKIIIRYNIEKDPKFSDFDTVFKYCLRKKLIEYSIITIFLSLIITIAVNQ